MPALFETTVRLPTPASRIASISAAAMPQSPKPPDMIIMPSRSTPARAASALGYTLFAMIDLLLRGLRRRVSASPAPA